MDGQLVSGSPSTDDTVGGRSESSAVSYGKQFWDMFPVYLAMGMTEEQYWDGDPMLAKYYRKAEEIRNERRNQELWLQGMYVYDAILCASPILRAFAKKGAKPKPYPTQPYALTAKERKKEKEDKERKVYAKGKQYMEAFMASTNKKFQKPQES